MLPVSVCVFSTSNTISASLNLTLKLTDNRAYRIWTGLAACFGVQKIARKARVDSGPKRESRIRLLLPALGMYVMCSTLDGYQSDERQCHVITCHLKLHYILSSYMMSSVVLCCVMLFCVVLSFYCSVLCGVVRHDPTVFVRSKLIRSLTL